METLLRPDKHNKQLLLGHLACSGLLRVLLSRKVGWSAVLG